MENTNLMQYSMELAMLTNLKNHNLITEVEFETIKQELRRNYHIITDLVVGVA